jgi:opacity protein-like surface antigen
MIFRTLLVSLSAGSIFLGAERALAADVDSGGAEDVGLYLSAFGGITWPDVDGTGSILGVPSTLDFHSQSGRLIGVAVGADVYENVRAELEVSYLRSDLDSVFVSGVGTSAIDLKVTSTYVLGNAWMDLPMHDSFVPYVGLGLGLSRQKIESLGKDFGLAAQVGAGLNMALTEAVSIDAGYRFKTSTDIDLDATAGLDLNLNHYAHVAQIGLTVKF